MSGPINITATAPEPIPVTLVEKKYTIYPPKAALAMRLAVESKLYEDDPAKMGEILDSWINKAFGEKADKVRDRLADSDDLLDIMHIMALMEKVIEVQMDEDPTS